MATTPNALDYLSKATNTPKVNLFDFPTVENVQRPNIQQPANQLQQETQKPVQQNVIQDFLNQTKGNTEFTKKRKAVIEMLQNEEEDSFIEDAIVNQMKFTPKQPSYLDKVGTTFKGLVGATPEAVKKIGGGITEVGTTLFEGTKGAIKDIAYLKEGVKQEDPSFIGRTFDKFGEAQEGIKEAKIAEVKGKQTGAKSFLQSMGLLGLATSETIGDAFISGLKTIAPKQLEELAKDSVQNALQTKGGQVVQQEIQEAIDGYEYLKETDPVKARDYKAYGGFLSFAADLTGISTVAKVGAKEVGKETIKQTGRQVIKPVGVAKLVEQTIPSTIKTGKETAKKIIPTALKTTKETIEGGKKIIQKPFKKPTTKKPTLREEYVGLTEKDIKALSKTDEPTFTKYVKEAKDSLTDDYIQTPYHKGAVKAEDAFKKLEKNLNSSYQKKAKILKTSKVKLNNTKVKTDIDDFLETKLNVKVIDGPDGKTFAEIKGRGAQIDITSAGDLQAYQQLQKVLKSTTPLEYADRLQAMQGWIYENSKIGITGGVSKKMKAFITQATGKANKNLKAQIPTKYSKVMDEMVGDINLSDDLKRVFRVDGTSNRGELAMKRLVAGTTTSGDARKLAIAIKERTGIDLIKEARLRQLTMEMVGDIRGETLFGLIEKHGVLGAGIGKGKQLLKSTVLDPEKAALKRVGPTKVKPRKVKKPTKIIK